MKAVLVIDIPEEYMGSIIDVKLYGKTQTVNETYVNKLRPLPKRYDEGQMREQKGWNACLDEITGETE